MNHTIAAFAQAARDYCQWAEHPDMIADMGTVQRHLVRLYGFALDLPHVPCSDSDAPPIPHDEWERVFQRAGLLPMGYYSHCFDPLHVSSGEAGLGDLADDLADIWSDVKSGLLLYDAGDQEAAAWEWRQNFYSHWGTHAASALHAVHCWLIGPGMTNQPGP